MKLTKATSLGALFASLAMCSYTATANMVNTMPILSFDDDQNSQDGVINYDGMGGALYGSGIDFHSVVGVGTPLANGVDLECIDCTLTFQTGANVSEGPYVWECAGGGSLSIVGTLETAGGTLVADGTGLTPLVSGSFTSAFVTSGVGLTVSGFGTDTKHPDLVEYYGLGPLFQFAQTEIALGGVTYDVCGGYYGGYADCTGGFTAYVTNADFDNTAIPVPAAVWLFGSGLLGLVGIARRRRA